MNAVALKSVPIELYFKDNGHRSTQISRDEHGTVEILISSINEGDQFALLLREDAEKLARSILGIEP
jgi:hypothetical protein